MTPFNDFDNLMLLCWIVESLCESDHSPFEFTGDFASLFKGTEEKEGYTFGAPMPKNFQVDAGQKTLVFDCRFFGYWFAGGIRADEKQRAWTK